MLLNDNFWKWFGNSKMKTKNGKPIVFYHTTYSNIDIFEPVIYNNGNFIPSEKGVDHFHFSKYKEWTDNFAKDEFVGSDYNNRKTYEVFLKIENPLIILPIERTVGDWVKYLNDKNVNISLEEILHISTFGNDFDNEKIYKIPLEIKKNKEKKAEWLKNAIEQNKQWYANHKCEFWKIIRNSNKVLSSYCKQAGYDGILMRDTKRDDARNLTVIVFDSNQIKSINNNGEYSMEKNNINESYILNEKFSMDNWKKKDYDKIIDEIINQENTNLDTSAEDSYEIRLLNLPQEVKDLILVDYITKEKPKQDAHRMTYQTPEQIQQIKDDSQLDWGAVDAWYVMEHPYARKYIEKFCMNEFKKTYNFIESLGNPMTLYRFVHFDYNKNRAPGKNLTKLSPEELASQILKRDNIHLGVCWTPHWEKAVEFGMQEHTVDDYCMIIEAKVPRDAVNLPNTLIKRSQLTYYNYEDEIELIKGSKIYVEAFNFYNNHDDTWFEAGGRKYYKV